MSENYNMVVRIRSKEQKFEDRKFSNVRHKVDENFIFISIFRDGKEIARFNLNADVISWYIEDSGATELKET
jgi:hypothetical protein